MPFSRKRSSKTREKSTNNPVLKKHKGWKQTKMTMFGFRVSSGKYEMDCKKGARKEEGDIKEDDGFVCDHMKAGRRSDEEEQAKENVDSMLNKDVNDGAKDDATLDVASAEDLKMEQEVMWNRVKDEDVDEVHVAALSSPANEAQDAADKSDAVSLDLRSVKEVGSSKTDEASRETVGENVEQVELRECSGQSIEQQPKKLKLGAEKSQPESVPKVKPVNWMPESPAPYLHLVRTYEALEKTPGRLESIDLLKIMFKTIVEKTPEDLLPAVYLTVGRLAPAWENVTLSLGGSTIARAITTTCSVSHDTLRAKYKNSGDLGDAALAVSLRVRRLAMPRPLTIRSVYKNMKQLAEISGKGGQKQKSVIVTRMVASCREAEIKYVVRTLISNLRIGAVDKTVLGSLAAVFDIPPDSLASLFATCPSYNVLIPALLDTRKEDRQGQKGGNALEILSAACKVTAGIPLKPMLGKIIRSIEEVLNRFGEDVQVLSEYKYDGQRAQTHVSTSGSQKAMSASNEHQHEKAVKVQLFSRHLQDITGRFPDVCEIVRRVAVENNLESGIFDTEIVAVDTNNVVLPFQALAARPRSGANSAASFENNRNEGDPKQVQVCVVCFDVMMLNEEILLSIPLEERRSKMYTAMKKSFGVSPGWKFAESMKTRDPLAVKEFLDKAVRDRCEGLICKALSGPYSMYEPATRRESWSKVKKDYISGGGLDLDVIPIGGWHGNGRKHKWFSPVLVAVWHDGELQSLCKVMSGFTDEMYSNLAKYYRDGRILETKPSYYQVDEVGMRPSVWFEASQVWEIRGADLSISPVHKAARGLVDETKGLSLRFPRFIRIRDDKGLDDATSAQDVAEMFCGQANRAPAGMLDAGGVESE